MANNDRGVTPNIVQRHFGDHEEMPWNREKRLEAERVARERSLAKMRRERPLKPPKILLTE